MESIDRNDVNISKLFGWKGEKPIVDTTGKVILNVYMRLVGDADINIARTLALRDAAKLRSKMSDKNSDEYLAYTVPEDLLDKDTLIILILNLMIKDFSEEAISSIDIPIPTEPDEHASQEEQEEYQKKVDNYPVERLKKLNEFVTEKTKQKEQELKQLPEDKLYALYIKTLTNRLCNNKLTETFQNYCAYAGCYKDNKYKEKFFSNFDEFLNLPPDIKEQIISNYQSLDLSGEELKK